MEQSVTLIGNLYNNLMYNRRLTVLSAVMKEHKAKQLLKEKHNIFSGSYDELFGKCFRDDWFSNLKLKQKYQEIMRKESVTQPASSSSASGFRGKQPFRGGPPASSNGGGGRTPQAYFVRSPTQQRQQYGKNNNITLPQHSSIFYGRHLTSATLNSKLIKKSDKSSCPGSGKNKILFKKLGKINTRWKHTIHCARLQNPFHTDTIPELFSTCNKNEPRREASDKLRNSGNVEETCNSSSRICSRGVSQQLIFRWQKRWGQQASDQFKTSEQFYSLSAFQNGRNALTKRPSTEKGLFNKTKIGRAHV